MEATHLRELDDASKPHRRVWRCGSGVHVKTYATPHATGFGRVQWTFTASHCNEAGDAFAYRDGFAVHMDHHELIVASDAALSESARAQAVRAAFEAALLVVVARVEAAVLNERAALTLST